MGLVGRGRNYPRFGAFFENLENKIYKRNWPARLAFKLRMQNKIDVIHHTIHSPRLPQSAPPLKIAFASDFHSGPMTHNTFLKRAIQQIDQLQADLILLGGDFVTYEAQNIDVLASELARLQAPLGIYAVLGNHDLWADDAYIVAQLENAGVQVLINRNIKLPAPFSDISLCGLDDWWAGAPDRAAAFEGAEESRIVLMHSPENYKDLEDDTFEVAFCGHTHGGQIALPGRKPLILPGRVSITAAHDDYCKKYNYGRFNLDDKVLIVSNGVGYGGLPIRLIAWPEIVCCQLKHTEALPANGKMTNGTMKVPVHGSCN